MNAHINQQTLKLYYNNMLTVLLYIERFIFKVKTINLKKKQPTTHLSFFQTNINKRL